MLKALSHRAVGAKGERIAARYLKRLGYKIKAKNFRSAHGEIDIIAQKDGRTVFVEVKARTEDPQNASRFGRPANAVNKLKKTRFLSCVFAYQKKHPESLSCRVDVIEVLLPGKQSTFKKPQIMHTVAAFGANDYDGRLLRPRR